MKRISILVFIALIAMSVEMVTAVVDAWGGSNAQSLIREKLEQDGLREEGHGMLQVLNVAPVDAESITGTLLNKKSGKEFPYAVHQINTMISQPWWVAVMRLLLLPFIPLIIWGLANFIKLLISVFKHEIFTRKNARRLRIFVYTSYGSLAVFTLLEWLTYRYAAAQVELPGYYIKNYEFVMNWSDMLLVFLIVEIFALGVKLQEDQELTI